MHSFHLNHFAILTKDMQSTIDFYVRYIGLEHGACLDGGYGQFLYFPGTDQAVVHLLGLEAAEKINNNKEEGFQLHATLQNEDSVNNTKTLDHIAFVTSKDGFDEVIVKLEKDATPYRLGSELAPKNLQLWILDPNGIKVEVGCFPEKDLQS
jgi:catechol 2,3-dioxygenase-like lactoylglutathione lyase family enzyme